MGKSKLPDLKEVTDIAGKLFTDIKKSVSEIYHEYKTKREAECCETENEEQPSKKNKPKTSKPKTSKTKADTKDNEQE